MMFAERCGFEAESVVMHEIFDFGQTRKYLNRIVLIENRAFSERQQGDGMVTAW